MTTRSDLQPMTILSERLVAHTPQSLFAAFADPARLKLWWGPDGFTNSIHNFDFRPGGKWHFTMHAPDGSNFENNCTFGEIVTDRQITFVHHLPMHVFTMTMTFTPRDEGTLLVWHMEFEPDDNNEALRPFITAANEQNFDRLEANIRTHGATS
jgi:uncharacterized protein YndB with AHSA1/START domain